MTKVRTFIYGSCVSRDTFEFLDPQRFDLVKYVARQSLGSAFSPPHSLPMPSFQSTSSFQTRMLEGDWRGSLIPILRQYAPEIDLLLWDIFDERLGIYRLQNGKLVTRTADSIASGLDERVARDARFVPLGSPAHRQRFTQNLEELSRLLDQLQLRERTLLVAPPWATHFRDGSATPSSYGLDAGPANSIFDEYLELVQTSLPSVPVARPDSALADRAHRWGPAPFHYDEATYHHLAGSISAFAAPLPRRSRGVSPKPLANAAPPDRWERLIPHAVTRPMAAISRQSTSGSLRLPFRVSTSGTRWRIVIRNASYRSNKPYPGPATIRRLTLGRPMPGATGLSAATFADDPLVLDYDRQVEDLGQGWASAWFTAPRLKPHTDYLLGIGYETQGQDLHLSMGGGWWSQGRSDVVANLVDKGIKKVIRVPFDVRIELVTGFDISSDVIIGDSIAAGSNTTFPIRDAPIQLALRKSGRSIRMHTFGGATFGEWIGPNWGVPTSMKWGEVTEFGPAERVIIALGNNDIHAGLDLTTLKTKATQLASMARDRLDASVLGCTVTPRTAWADTPQERVRAQFNDWLRSVPKPFSGVFETAHQVEDGSGQAPRREFVLSDGVHFNVQGCKALAGAFTAVTAPVPKENR